MSFDMIKTFNYFKLLLRWRKRIFHKFFNFGISKFLVNNCNYLNNCQFCTETCHYRSQDTFDSLTIASAVYPSLSVYLCIYLSIYLCTYHGDWLLICHLSYHAIVNYKNFVFQYTYVVDSNRGRSYQLSKVLSTREVLSELVVRRMYDDFPK